MTELVKEKYEVTARLQELESQIAGLPLANVIEHYSVFPAAHAESASTSHQPASLTTRHYRTILCSPPTIPGTLEPSPESTVNGSRFSSKPLNTIFRNRSSSLDNIFGGSLPSHNETPEVRTIDTSALENQLEAIQQGERPRVVTDDTPELDITTSNLGNLDPETLSSCDDDDLPEQAVMGLASEIVTETSVPYSESLARRPTSNMSCPSPAESILGAEPPSPMNISTPFQPSSTAELRVPIRDRAPSIGGAATLDLPLTGISSD